MKYVLYDAYQHYGYRENKTTGPVTTGNSTIRGDTTIVCVDKMGCKGEKTIESNVTNPLDNADGKHPQVVCYSIENNHNDSSKDTMGFDAYNLDSTETKAKTLTAGRNDTHNIPVTCYGISAYNSNCMKSSNPHSGIYEAKTSRTLDLNGGNPACNQGGMIVVYDGQSCASNTETAYTIQASRIDDHHVSVVCHKSAGFVSRQGAKAGGWHLKWKKPQR